MSRLATNIVIAVSILLALAILGGLVWANSFYVRSQPVEKNFLVPWMAARTFVLYGTSPYDLSTVQRTQIVYYGKLAQPGQDPLYLWLPMPVELFYIPFGLIPDYAWARAAWLALIEIALISLAFLSLRVANLKPPRGILVGILLFASLSVYGIYSLLSSSGAVFAALAFIGMLLALKRGNDELAGACLLLSLGVPSITALLAFFMTWWVIFQRRWRILAGFFMILALLLALSFLLLPGWVFPFLTGLVARFRYNLSTSSLGIFASWSPVVGLRFGWIAAALMLLILFVEWGGALRNEYRHMLWTTNLTIVAMPLLGIPTTPADYVMLYVPMLLLLGVLAGLPPAGRQWRRMGIILGVTFVLTWLMVFLLGRAQAYTALAQTLFLLFPLALLPGLYWIRWRFMRRSPQWEVEE